MGGGASLLNAESIPNLPPRVDFDFCARFGITNAQFYSRADSTNTISKLEFISLLSATDVFLSHAWEDDRNGRPNNLKVSRLNEALVHKGMLTHLYSSNGNIFLI